MFKLTFFFSHFQNSRDLFALKAGKPHCVPGLALIRPLGKERSTMRSSHASTGGQRAIGLV